MRIRRLFSTFIFGLGLTMALVWVLGRESLSAAPAASISVNTSGDVIADDGNCSLREATLTAGRDTSSYGCTIVGGGPDVIRLGTGIYVLTSTGTGEDLGLTGDLDITSTLAIVGNGPGQTTIDASGLISDRAFHIHSTTGTVVISGVRIINGNVTGGGGPVTGNGGGIYNADADLILINTVVQSNAASMDGGGVYVHQGSLTSRGGQITSNTAGDEGGGVFVHSGSVTFTQTDDSIVGYNTAQDWGGGVYVFQGDLTLERGQIISNTADAGGGVYVHQGSLTLSGGQILSNTADHGGGVYVNQGSLTLEEGRIFSNSTKTATGDGGGVYVGTGSAMVRGGLILDNHADDDGGGMFVYSGTVTLSGGQILSNTTDSDGGGVYLSFSGAAFTQTGAATIAHNIAGQYGGGVYVFQGSATLDGGLISDNHANAHGGGVAIWEGNTTLGGGQILGNSANLGGGVYIRHGEGFFTQTGASTIARNTASSNGGAVYMQEGSATLGGALVFDNSAGNGGGVYVNSGTATMSGTQIISNFAKFDGGGVHVKGGSATLSEGQIVSNTASDEGGGLHNAAALSLVNTTVSHNRSDGTGGGGLYIVTGGTTAITFTTIASNTATSGGGGIHNAGGTIGVQNTIVAYNGVANCVGTLTSNDYNLENDTDCGFAATHDISGTIPHIGQLTYDGGTWIHPLMTGSPAIDKGLCLPSLTTVDQRGVARPQGPAKCDIGAYEFAGFAVHLPLVLRNHE